MARSDLLAIARQIKDWLEANPDQQQAVITYDTKTLKVLAQRFNIQPGECRLAIEAGQRASILPRASKRVTAMERLTGRRRATRASTTEVTVRQPVAAPGPQPVESRRDTLAARSEQAHAPKPPRPAPDVSERSTRSTSVPVAPRTAAVQKTLASRPVDLDAAPQLYALHVFRALQAAAEASSDQWGRLASETVCREAIASAPLPNQEQLDKGQISILLRWLHELGVLQSCSVENGGCYHVRQDRHMLPELVARGGRLEPVETLETLQGDVARLNASLTELRAKFATHRQDAASVQEELTRALASVEELRHLAEAAQGQAQQARAETGRAQARQTAAERELDELRPKLKELQTGLAAALVDVQKAQAKARPAAPPVVVGRPALSVVIAEVDDFLAARR